MKFSLESDSRFEHKDKIEHQSAPQQVHQQAGENYGCQKNVKLIGLLAQGMRRSAWLFYDTVIPVQDIKSSHPLICDI